MRLIQRETITQTRHCAIFVIALRLGWFSPRFGLLNGVGWRRSCGEGALGLRGRQGFATKGFGLVRNATWIEGICERFREQGVATTGRPC